ncbi:relaxase/mobilization nuclease domain-containing protein [Shewanella frigidimarina]|uniref:relaxase/mobilization nuclease domain-containing protein n=1 Tax=Shewanella frigidimarina TaxID=56812 RepID=UPI003D78B99C
MAIAKLLHEGTTIKQLNNVIRYNSVAKEYLNSPNNPRLLQAISNLGIIDISEPAEYQHFIREFVNEIKLNQSQSKNKRQTKLYAHEVISFEDEDNARFSQEQLAQISIELLSELYDMENTPYVIWPQTDSGRLHFHFVRSMYSSNGSYQRVKNSKRKMRQSCEMIELKYNLTLTGKNVSDEIRPANNPMAKIMKNRQIEAAHQHEQNINEAKKQDSTLTKLKRKSYDLLMEGRYQSKAESAEQNAYEQIKHNLLDKAQVNQKIEMIKQTIFNLYKSSDDETDFIEQIEKQGISVEVLKHTKSGKNKGIAFHYQGETISGGKISSSMTLGKIKKRFPNFIHSLEQPPTLSSTFKLQRKMLDFQIEQINRYYKQRKNKANDDILIYFSKKNIEARPYNYNLKLSSTRDSIRFGPSTPNDHDLTLSINIALENGWQGATLKNSTPDFLKRMMKAAYKKDPKLLFFVKPDHPNQLTYTDLKEIKSPLTIDDLKTTITSQLVKISDFATVHQDLIKQLELDKNNHAYLGYASALKSGFILDELEKKTPEQLEQFYHHKTFHSLNKRVSRTVKKTSALTSDIDGRAACLEALKSEMEINPQDVKSRNLKKEKQHHHNFKYN